jgi:hypothetical protein
MAAGRIGATCGRMGKGRGAGAAAGRGGVLVMDFSGWLVPGRGALVIGIFWLFNHPGRNTINQGFSRAAYCKMASV